MGSFESLPVDPGAPLSPDLYAIAHSKTCAEPLHYVRAVWNACHLLSSSLPYVTLDVFAKANTFLTPNQVILTAKHFELKGTGALYAVNMHEYVSVLTLLSDAEWVTKGRVLFGMFDFDGSEGLNKDESVILITSLYGGLAKATGQIPPTAKQANVWVQNVFNQIRSMREVSLGMVLDYLQTSSLHTVLARSKPSEGRKLPSSFFAFHKHLRQQPTTPASTNALSFSRKSSRMSHIDYSPSVNKSLERSRGLNDSSRLTPRDQFSLPPPLRRMKGLIIVIEKQDSEHVTRRTIAELHTAFSKSTDQETGFITARRLASALPRISKKAAERVQKQVEGEGGVDFEGFLRLVYPRATNTQMTILMKWTRDRPQGMQLKRKLVVQPSRFQGEFFILPTQSTTRAGAKSQERRKMPELY